MKLNDFTNIILEKMIPYRVKHLLELERKEMEEIALRQKFGVENFILPVVPEHAEAVVEMGVSRGMSDKMKVRIIQLDYQYFNAIDTICQNLQQDKRVDLLLLVDSGVDKQNTELLLGKGYNCCEISQYAIGSDTPDIVIETMTYRNLSYDLSYKKIKKYAGTFILIPLEIVNYYEREYGIMYWKETLRKIRPDVTILDKSLYEFLSKRIRGYKFVKMGHAKYDTIYKKLNSDIVLLKDWAGKMEGGGELFFGQLYMVLQETILPTMLPFMNMRHLFLNGLDSTRNVLLFLGRQADFLRNLYIQQDSGA